MALFYCIVSTLIFTGYFSGRLDTELKSSFYFDPLSDSLQQHFNNRQRSAWEVRRHWLIVGWLIKWLIDRLNGWWIEWFVVRLIDRSIDLLNGWLIEWLSDGLIYWMDDWLNEWVMDWSIDWLIHTYFFACCSAGRDWREAQLQFVPGVVSAPERRTSRSRLATRSDSDPTSTRSCPTKPDYVTASIAFNPSHPNSNRLRPDFDKTTTRLNPTSSRLQSPPIRVIPTKTDVNTT